MLRKRLTGWKWITAVMVVGVAVCGGVNLSGGPGFGNVAVAQEDADTDADAWEDTGDAENAGDAEVAPAPVPAPGSDFSFSRDWGKGGYVAIWKFLVVLVVYLCWVYTTDWLSADCLRYRMGIAKWVPIVYGAFLGTLLLFFLIPWFWVGIVLLLGGYIAPLAIYIRLRNRDLSYGEQVLTLAHLRFVFSEVMALIGVKIAAEAPDKNDIGFPVLLYPHGKDQALTETWRIQARAHAGYPNAREILSRLMEFHPEGLMLEFTATGVTAKYQLDGVWNGAGTWERVKADPALAALKILCGMKPEDRKNRQEGKFRVVFEYEYTFPEDRLRIRQIQERLDATPEDELVQLKEIQAELRIAKEEAREPVKRKRDVVVTLTTMGVPGGERAVFMFEQGLNAIRNIDQIGMTAEMQAQVRKALGGERGFFLYSAPPASGMRTTMTTTLMKTDRYTREFYEVQDGVHKYAEVENIQVEVCESADPEAWHATLRNIFLKDPNVLVVRDVPNPAVMDDLMKFMDEQAYFCITSIRAKDAAEALLRVMATKCDAKGWAKNVQAVLCQRLVRKLCGHCRESFQPNATTLQQLGFKPGRYTFYRTPTPKPVVPGRDPEEPCKECRGIGYSGRTAVFELVIIGENTRKALLTQPKLEIVRKALRMDGNQFMMDMGLQLVRDGVTSLQELKRALS